MTRDSLNALESSIALLEQGLDLLRVLADGDYRECPPGRSSVGAQYRHVLDHYRALVDGIEEARVDYDARRRNVEVETDRDVAGRDTGLLIERLGALDCTPYDTPLQVVAACSAQAPGEPQPSSLGRELHFLVSHTVHHYAIIKLLLASAEKVPCDFGVAPSTVAWQRSAH
ncbi:MAG TPA: DinB family protein [Gemmatimonadales bacterium]|nr:DinB family protein [Gemmatimonadales bacterium]